MFNRIKEIITGIPAGPRITVEVIEACAVAGRRIEVGEQLTLPRNEAGALIAAGRARRVPTAADQAEAERLETIVPPPWTPRPMPEQWAALPEPFQKFWEINERFRCAIGRRDELQVLVLRGQGLTPAEIAMFKEEANHMRLGEDGHTPRSKILHDWLAVRDKFFKVTIITGNDDDAHRERAKLLDSLNRAEDAIRDLRREHGDELLRLKFGCSDLVLDMNARCRAVARELETVAYEIFLKRIGPLGLGDYDNRRLFHATAERALYVHRIEEPSGVKIAWYEERGGELRRYIDGEVSALAGHYESNRLRLDALEGLLTEARKESKRATRVIASAA